MTQDDNEALLELASVAIFNGSIIPPILARAILELREKADFVHPTEWPIGKSYPQTDLLPKLPTLGGMTSPQDWLRQIAHFDRLKRANARAREAEQIADWIDSVVALASPPQDNEPAFAEVDEEETSCETAAQPDPHSRVCARDALAALLDEGWHKLQGHEHITNLLLDHLQEHHRATYGYRSGWIERIKVGDL